MYKIVFIDIDGTLKNEKRETTKRTKNAILKCTQKGILIVILVPDFSELTNSILPLHIVRIL